MRRGILPLVFASATISAVAVTLVVTVQGAAEIEEPLNIVVLSQTVSVARITFFVALAHAVLLGVPAYLLLRPRLRVGFIACCIGGFAVGAVPLGILGLFTMTMLTSASTGGTPTVVNHVPTLAGWIEYAEGVGWAGLLGLIGGVAFWIGLRFSGQTSRENFQVGPQSTTRLTFSFVAISIAILSAAAIVLLPSFVTDNSCHNLFRNGRTSIGPQVLADINLGADDWPRLQRLLSKFASANSLSFRADEQIRDGKIFWRDLNLCDDNVNIDALDQPWLSQINSPLAGRGINLSIYQLRSSSDWKPLARGVLNQIEARWPGRTTFTGPDGNTISIQQAMEGRK